MFVYLALIDNEADRSKFEKLYTMYRNKMLQVANQILHDRHAAEDMTHQAFLQIIENIEKIVDVDSPKTKAFVVIIVERLAINEYHRRKRHPENNLNAWTKIEFGATPEQIISDKDRFSLAMAMLPERQYEVIMLKYCMGYQEKEIAQMLAVTEGAVRKTITRGKARLQELLGEEEDVEL